MTFLGNSVKLMLKKIQKVDVKKLEKVSYQFIKTNLILGLS